MICYRALYATNLAAADVEAEVICGLRLNPLLMIGMFDTIWQGLYEQISWVFNENVTLLDITGLIIQILYF